MSHVDHSNLKPDQPLDGYNVVLAVTGSIAAYKAAYIASQMVKLGAVVDVMMTENALRFIGRSTFSALTHRPVTTSLWEANSDINIDHVALGVNANCIVIAPATANILAKLASGITDDAVTATVLASDAPLVIAPAMDADMFSASATQRNIATLKQQGTIFLGPESGRLASGIVGEGRMSEPDDIVDHVRAAIGAHHGDYSGRKVVVTAGGTREPIDPVRVITNRSTGKMGYAIAEAARDRGADVTLVTAPASIRIPAGMEIHTTETVEEMRDATIPACKDADLLVMAAAISDFRPALTSTEKIKKSDNIAPNLQLEAIEDWMPLVRGDRLVKVAFAAESGNAATKATAKVDSKGAVFTVANDITEHGSGFGTDTNRVDLVDANGLIESLPLMSKYSVANVILDRASRYFDIIELKTKN